MLVGYMRVSTAERNFALQRDALLAASIAPERIYDDTCSCAVTNRPGLARALEELGRYAFILPDGIARGELRPLRDPCHTADEG